MILVYGATGYTGGLVVDEALRRGLTPIVAGRDAEKVKALATRSGLPMRVFSVEAPDLSGVKVLLNIAGPFSRTARPLVDACLAAGVHYLDVTGEIAVFEALAARDGEARAAGILLLPGVGFDVVPTDCVAAHLKARLPDATRLALAIASTGGGVSHGTATTAIENLDGGSAVRRAGRIVHLPTVGSRTIDFGQGPKTAVSIPWGDVSTAWHTTGIPDIEVLAAVPAVAAAGLRAAPMLAPLLRSTWMKRALQAWVDRRPEGPDAATRATSTVTIHGEVENAAGRSVRARLVTPEAYTLTAWTAIEAAVRVDDAATRGEPLATGFRTPAGLFGADFVLGFPGVALEELSPEQG